MATLLLTAAGTALGGPIGGAIGALAGREVDSMVLGGRAIHGPRLKDFSVQTSSYGDALPLHFGTVRSAGTVIWSTELVEQEARSDGGKGQPTVTTYTYSASFAVAVASRPIASIGRIWADGNLLRGAAGDLKVGGTMRVHAGFGDQNADPLLAQAEAAGHCPAYRGIAYVVFEDLQLADFGNRIPSLTFEIFADAAGCDVASICQTILPEARCTGLAQAFAGFSIDQGTAGDTIAVIGRAIPISAWLSGETVALADAMSATTAPPMLPLPAAGEDANAQDLKNGGWSRRREPLPRARQCGLRYYDVARDYQPGLQRGKGRSEQGDLTIIDLPATLAAEHARALADRASQRLSRPTETLVYRTTSIDPALFAGPVVRTPISAGAWRIDDWEWQKDGVLLQLTMLHDIAPSATDGSTDAGRHNPVVDAMVTPTQLQAFELPWDGTGNGNAPVVFAAASSSGAGWKGAALFAPIGSGTGDIASLGTTGRRRATTGVALNALGLASPLLRDLCSTLDVQLAAVDLDLSAATLAAILNGANRALVGEEIVQFANADPLGAGRWRLSGLLRGRGGTEWAIGSHAAGEPFTLLDSPLVSISAEALAGSTGPLLAVGLNETTPVSADIHCAGATLRPLSPVHGAVALEPDGSVTLTWVRRARGAWAWFDFVDTPLNEEREAWDVVLGDPAAPLARWTCSVPRLSIPAGELPTPPLSGTQFSIRQIGRASLSPALTIAFPA